MESLKSFLGGVAATVLGGLLLIWIWGKNGSNEALVPASANPSIDTADQSPITFLAPTIRFFESGDTTVARGGRVYLDSFPQSTARYVNWELSVSHQPAPKYKKFYVVAVFYRSDGIEYARETLPTNLEKGWTDSYHTWGWGWNTPGYWPKDQYKVELSVDNQPLVSGNFVIY